MPVPWPEVKVNISCLSRLIQGRSFVLEIGGDIGVMLIITSETQPATASIQGFFARGYRHGQPQPGCARAKAIVDEIHVTSEPDSRSAVLRLDGSLHTPIDGVLRSTVDSLFHGGVRRVLLDLSGVGSIDAAGVGELVHICTTAAAAGRVVQIERMSSHVRRVLEVTGVRWLLDVESPGAGSTCR